MRFSTKLILKSDKPELFPGETVLIQHPRTLEEGKTNTYFTLNKDSMLAMLFTPNTAKVNDITWGIDENTGNLMLAAGNLDKDKSSRITKENKFSNQKFLDKLTKQFGVDSSVENVFTLDIVEEEGIMFADIKLREVDSSTEDIMEDPYPGFSEKLSLVGNEDTSTTTNLVVDQSTESFDTAMETERKNSGIVF